MYEIIKGATCAISDYIMHFHWDVRDWGCNHTQKKKKWIYTMKERYTIGDQTIAWNPILRLQRYGDFSF